jgi:cellulase/cellobiase CelA1
VVGQWPGGFQGEVKVTNSGTSAASGWSLTWTYGNGQVVNQSWGGKFTQTGSTVTAGNEAWNGALAAGGSSTVGFLGSWNSSNTVPAVTCTVS